MEDILNTAVDAEEYDDQEQQQESINQILEKKRTEFLIYFLKNYKENKITPYYKSATTKDPIVQRNKVFYNVVGDTYDEVVENSNESFMLLVCLQSFDHCIDLKKSIREIGMHLMAYGNFIFF